MDLNTLSVKSYNGFISVHTYWEVDSLSTVCWKEVGVHHVLLLWRANVCSSLEKKNSCLHSLVKNNHQNFKFNQTDRTGMASWWTLWNLLVEIDSENIDGSVKLAVEKLNKQCWVQMDSQAATLAFVLLSTEPVE